MANPHWGIIARPAAPPVADALPTWRWRWVNRLRARFHLPLDERGADQISLFLRLLRTLLSRSDYCVLDATLLFDGGKGQPTGYHNDLWFSAPLQNRVLQLWIPLVCEGAPQEIARSMVRLDPDPLGDGWGCASGLAECVHLWTGEKRPLRHLCPGGKLEHDLPGALGGDRVQPGDVLYFDNAYCHYTLPSRARRVAVAVRLSRGLPTYNGYFTQPRPLDGRGLSEGNRRSIARLFQDVPRGDQVSPDSFFHRLDAVGLRDRAVARTMMLALLATPRRKLHPTLVRYAEEIAARLSSLT